MTSFVDTSLSTWYAHCLQKQRRDNKGAGRLLCCGGWGGYHGWMEKTMRLNDSKYVFDGENEVWETEQEWKQGIPDQYTLL